MKPEIIAAVASSVIALIALVVSLYELKRARQESRLSRLPLVKVALGTEPGGFLSFSLENEGNGAAFIEEVIVTVDDEPCELPMLFTRVFGEGKEFVCQRLVHTFPKIIQAKSREEIFRIAEQGPRPRSDVQLMHEFAGRVGIAIRSRPLRVEDERSEIQVARLAQRSQTGFGVDT